MLDPIPLSAHVIRVPEFLLELALLGRWAAAIGLTASRTLSCFREPSLHMVARFDAERVSLTAIGDDRRQSKLSGW